MTVDYDRVAEAEANLAMVKLEQKLIELKESDPDGDELRDVKLQLREARQAFREQRDARQIVDGVPDGVAVAETVNVKSDIKKVRS